MEEGEKVFAALGERLDKNDRCVKEIQNTLSNICNELRRKIDEIEEKINRELEYEFMKEESRLQSALSELRKSMDVEEEKGKEANADAERNAGSPEFSKAVATAGSKLLIGQTYELVKRDPTGDDVFSKMYSLKTERRTLPECVAFVKPIIVKATCADSGYIFIEMAPLVSDDSGIDNDTFSSLFIYKALVYRNAEADGTEFILNRESGNNKSIFTFKLNAFEIDTMYKLKMYIVYNGVKSLGSDMFEFKTPDFSVLKWRDCQEPDPEKSLYIVDGNNPRIATKISGKNCAILGSHFLPMNRVLSWDIKVLKSCYSDGCGICVGVAPFDATKDDDDYKGSGWYFDCYSSSLWSGPPHNYKDKPYGPRKKRGEYVHNKNSVGVTMDTTKGELSFALEKEDLGVAFEDIPLDNPLVPFVILNINFDSVEIKKSRSDDDLEEEEETAVFVPIPSNIKVSNTTWDSVTLAWYAVDEATGYKLEMDGKTTSDVITKNTFTKKGLLPSRTYMFRICAVNRTSESEWSSVVNTRTKPSPAFSECYWKECPEYVDDKMKYSLSKRDHRILEKIDWDGYGLGSCVTIGTAPIPINSVTSWDVVIMVSKYNNSHNISVGVAPFDIAQDNEDVIKKCGWYIDCWKSTLFSGPPHNYDNKEYGPRKKRGEYVRTGNSVGVVMDTKKGELSFVLNKVNLGVAYEGVPLSKPLVPCVILRYPNDVVNLLI